jgi:hypothetical protein
MTRTLIRDRSLSSVSPLSLRRTTCVRRITWGRPLEPTSGRSGWGPASARTGARCDESHSRRLRDVLSKGNPCRVHRRDRLRRSWAATSVRWSDRRITTQVQQVRRVVRQRHHLGSVACRPHKLDTKSGGPRSISTCTQLRLLGAPRVGGPASSTVCRSSVRWLQQHSEGDTRHRAFHDNIGKPSGEGHLGLCGCRAQESADRQEGNTSRTGELHRELGSWPPLVQDRRASFRPGRWIQSGRHRIPLERLGLGHGVGRGRGHPGGHVCRHPIGCHRGVQRPLAILRSTREQVVSREHPRPDKGNVRCHRRGDETDEFLGVRHPAV